MIPKVSRVTLALIVVTYWLAGGNACLSAASDGSIHSVFSRLGSGDAIFLQADARWLEVGGPVVRCQLIGGQQASFRIPLNRDQFANLSVQQNGIDLVIAILDKSGRRLCDMDSPNGLQGVESLSIIAPEDGDYIVEVKSPDKWGPSGAFDIRLDSVRSATLEDRQRVAAERAFMEGQEARGNGTVESRRRATARYFSALAIWKELRDGMGQTYALCALGRVFKDLGAFQESFDYFNKSLSLCRSMKDHFEEAYVLNEIGGLYRDLADPLKSLEYYEKALALRQTLKDEWGEALTLNNIGIIYARTGNFSKAVEYYDRALPLWQRRGDRGQEANTRNALAGALDELGQCKSALEILDSVLKFCQEARNRALEAFVQNNIGKIYDTWGESQRALDHYRTAVQLYEDTRNLSGKATALDNIGVHYEELGDPSRALDFLNESLEIRHQGQGGPRGEANTLSKIGYSYSLLGDQEKALQYYGQSLSLLHQAGDTRAEAYLLITRGISYAALAEFGAALADYRRAVDLHRGSGDTRGNAFAIEKMGEAYQTLGKATEALEQLPKALGLFRSIGDRQGEAQDLYTMSRAEFDIGALAASQQHVEQAIQLIESLRVKTASQQLRANFFASKQDLYRFDIQVQMALHKAHPENGFDAAALYTNERARARVLLDRLGEGHVDAAKEASPALLERKRDIQRQLSTTAERSLRARNEPGRGEDAKALAKQVDSLTRDYDDVEAQIRAQSKSYKALTESRFVSAKDIQAGLLDEDTVLIEYSLGERQSSLWVVAADAPVRSYELPGRAVIEKAALEFRETLTARQNQLSEDAAVHMTRVRKADSRYIAQATELGRMLLGPCSPFLGDKRLVIVADGVLQLIPFEALILDHTSMGKQANPAARTASSLVVNHEIVYEPSASAVALLRSQPARPTSKNAAIFADPVFDGGDARVSNQLSAQDAAHPGVARGDMEQALRDAGGNGARLDRLFSSRDEANGIVAMSPPGSTFLALDFRANKDAFRKEDLSQYRIIHFATHGVMDDVHPELSGIILSLVDEHGRAQEGFLRLGDIYALNLQADLVVLSACRTGLGKDVKGEGMMSLTRAFLYAGSARVVSSLWKVDDEVTAELMKSFYRGMLKDGMSPVSALRQAKIQIQTRNRWKSPFYWAGFVIQGDWR
jgi:CHAT domain-containing protein/Tfp pilus assembly protein PilF